jgi:hypothetical protein
METLAEFLFPCCMAAGCSPATNQIKEVNQLAYFDDCETLAGHCGHSSIYVSEESLYEILIGQQVQRAPTRKILL